MDLVDRLPGSVVHDTARDSYSDAPLSQVSDSEEASDYNLDLDIRAGWLPEEYRRGDKKKLWKRLPKNKRVSGKAKRGVPVAEHPEIVGRGYVANAVTFPGTDLPPVHRISQNIGYRTKGMIRSIYSTRECPDVLGLQGYPTEARKESYYKDNGARSVCARKKLNSKGKSESTVQTTVTNLEGVREGVEKLSRRQERPSSSHLGEYALRQRAFWELSAASLGSLPLPTNSSVRPGGETPGVPAKALSATDSSFVRVQSAYRSHTPVGKFTYPTTATTQPQNTSVGRKADILRFIDVAGMPWTGRARRRAGTAGTTRGRSRSVLLPNADNRIETLADYDVLCKSVDVGGVASATFTPWSTKQTGGPNSPLLTSFGNKNSSLFVAPERSYVGGSLPRNSSGFMLDDSIRRRSDATNDRPDDHYDYD